MRRALMPGNRQGADAGGGDIYVDSDGESRRLLSTHSVGMARLNALYGKPRKIWTYVLDWILVIGFVVAFLAIDAVHGHQQEFSLTDQTIMYTFADSELVPSWLLVVVAVVIPVAIILLWIMLIPPLGHAQRSRWKKGELSSREKIWDVNLSLLGIGLAIASTITITNSFKNLVGRPRPDFLDRCQPSAANNPTVFTLSNASICTQTALLKEGFRSFPSGHSSLSFAGLGFLSLFLAGRLSLLDTRGEVWKTVVTLIPLVAAGFVAVSRLMNNRHHPFDVIVGSGLGMLLAWLSYRQYFPALSRADGGHPYSIAEFATGKEERLNVAYASASAYPPESDLELGRTRHRSDRTDAYNAMETDTEAGSPRDCDQGEGSGSFDGNT